MKGAGAKKHALLTEIADIVDDRVVTNDTYTCIWFGQ